MYFILKNMKNLAYNNLNSSFTFNTIWSLFTKFWINEVMNIKLYSKIWLTIIVYNSNEKSFTLINNLPFNINSYTDVLIVLKQVFNTSFFNDRDILNTIVFKYHFECKNNYKRDIYNTNMFIYISIIIIAIILLFCTFILYTEIYSIYNTTYIDEEILNYANEKIKNNNISKPFIFSPFIELFNANNEPSKFLALNDNYFWVVENCSTYNQGVQMDLDETTTKAIIKRLNNQLESSEILVNDLFGIIKQLGSENYVSFF